MALMMPNHITYQVIPEPRPLGKRLLERVDVTLPDAIPIETSLWSLENNSSLNEKPLNYKYLCKPSAEAKLEDPIQFQVGA